MTEHLISENIFPNIFLFRTHHGVQAHGKEARQILQAMCCPPYGKKYIA